MLQEAAPDEIFLSSEPYPFGQKHIAELQAYCPQARIRLVDGELFSWYGSRLQKSVPYFLDLLKESREVDWCDGSGRLLPLQVSLQVTK